MTKVSVAIIEKDGRILIGKRIEDDPIRNKWEFPGGKIEAGETPAQCLQREVFEELGIHVEIGEFICATEYHYEHESVILFAFKAGYPSAEPDLHYYNEIKWVKPADLCTYDFPEANVPIIQKLVDAALS
jgi:8-oxo-dGTP diphosphatase